MLRIMLVKPNYTSYFEGTKSDWERQMDNCLYINNTEVCRVGNVNDYQELNWLNPKDISKHWDKIPEENRARLQEMGTADRNHLNIGVFYNLNYTFAANMLLQSMAQGGVGGVDIGDAVSASMKHYGKYTTFSKLTSTWFNPIWAFCKAKRSWEAVKETFYFREYDYYFVTISGNKEYNRSVYCSDVVDYERRAKSYAEAMEPATLFTKALRKDVARKKGAIKGASGSLEFAVQGFNLTDYSVKIHPHVHAIVMVEKGHELKSDDFHFLRQVDGVRIHIHQWKAMSKKQIYSKFLYMSKPVDIATAYSEAWSPNNAKRLNEVICGLYEALTQSMPTTRKFHMGMFNAKNGERHTAEVEEDTTTPEIKESSLKRPSPKKAIRFTEDMVMDSIQDMEDTGVWTGVDTKSNRETKPSALIYNYPVVVET